MNNRLDQIFFERPVLTVARELLGQRLVRRLNGQRIAGLICETEAYRGEEDLACHARAGRTARTEVMYGPAGHAYVYFTYGMHWMLNFVCEGEGFPAAVLLRAIQPAEGIEIIAERRSGQPPARWTDGPAKICKALDIDGSLNGISITDPDSLLWVERADPVPDDLVQSTPRIGIPNVPEPWHSMPWRFLYYNKPLSSEEEK
jgi:DNA-3-methyladenine glycosylase